MDEWNDVKKKVGSGQVTRILENIDFGAVLHSKIIIILCHISVRVQLICSLLAYRNAHSVLP
jgi:hypothetical protein